MKEWVVLLLTVFGSITATSGFWTFLQSRSNKRDVTREMLVGLGHDRIIYLGMCYIDRGWCTPAEFENIEDYLYKPYSKMGGNGSAEKIIQQVRTLPIRNDIVEERRTHCRDHERLFPRSVGGVNID